MLKDLQKFAEDVVIPEELEGISADTAKEIMGEIDKPDEKEEPKTEPVKTDESVKTEKVEEPEKTETPAEGTTVEKASGDADTDKKPVAENNEHQIPYARFKEVNESKKKLELEVAELRKQLDNKPQNIPQPQANQSVASPQADLKAKQELIAKVDNIASQKAAEELGLTKEQLDGLDYSDDFPLKRKFEAARQIHISNIMERARQLQQEAYAKQAEQNTVYTQTGNDLEDMISKEKQEISNEKYMEILKYGENIVLPSLNRSEQMAVIAANNRINQKRAFPEDLITMRYIYDKAKKAYLGKQVTDNAQTVTTNKVNVQEKIKQAEALPKASQVGGTNDAKAGNYTQEELENYLNGDWDKVPEAAKKILRGY
jgi:hypothetical protein